MVPLGSGRESSRRGLRVLCENGYRLYFGICCVDFTGPSDISRETPFDESGERKWVPWVSSVVDSM